MNDELRTVLNSSFITHHSSLLLSSHPAAVHDEDVAVDVVARRRGEEDGRAREVLRLAPAGGRDAFEYLSVARLVPLQRRRVVGAHVAGRDGVDVDAPGRPLVGERLRELRHAALRRRVGGDGQSALEGEEGGDVDDLAAPALDHVAPGQLREAEDGREVDLDDGRPVLLRVIYGRRAPDGARVVDENVQT